MLFEVGLCCSNVFAVHKAENKRQAFKLHFDRSRFPTSNQKGRKCAWTWKTPIPNMTVLNNETMTKGSMFPRLQVPTALRS